MKLNHALNLLAKFFTVDADVFSRRLGKATIIKWAEQIKAETKKDLGDQYQLTQPQHAFLIGEIASFTI